jgi:putative ABC transport system substrate-binding protein
MRSNQLRRRDFITLLGGAALLPNGAQAQQSTAELPRICSIHTARNENFESYVRGLREAGYLDGRNARLVARFHGASLEGLDAIVGEFVDLKCSIIFASNPYAIQAATKATKTIPIIGVDLESDPVAEAVPAVSRLAVLWDATIGQVQFRATETAPRPPGITLQSLPIRRQEDINEAIQQALRDRANGLLVLSSPLIYQHRAEISSFALDARMPTISLFNTFPREGGLMAYGPDFPAIYAQAAGYVAQILKGANPGELPIQRPTKFELIINLKTAKALGLTISDRLLVRADQLIE